MIVSNPPFYEKELKGDDKFKNMAHHNEGLLLNQLIHIIRQNLKIGGTFYLLLPYKRNEEIMKLIKDNEFALKKLCFIKQTESHNYFRVILKAIHSHETTETVIEEIAIKDDNGNYTKRFTRLLEDYYLHL